MEDLRDELDEVPALEGDDVAGPGPPVCGFLRVEGLFGEPPRIVCGHHDLLRDIVGAQHDEHACPVLIVRAGVLLLRKDDLSAVCLDVEVLRGFAGALFECLDRVGLPMLRAHSCGEFISSSLLWASSEYFLES